jgi:hypothetical protein
VGQRLVQQRHVHSNRLSGALKPARAKCGAVGLVFSRPTLSNASRFSFFVQGAVLDCLRSRTLHARLPLRGTSGSVRRSPANPARPGREQRYRDRFVRRGVPEVPLICARRFSLWFSVSLCVLCVGLFGFRHRGHRERGDEKPGRDHGLTA